MSKREDSILISPAVSRQKLRSEINSGFAGNSANFSNNSAKILENSDFRDFWIKIMTIFNVFTPMSKREDSILISPAVSRQKLRWKRKKLRFFWHENSGWDRKNSGPNFKNSGFRDFPRVAKTEKWWKIKPAISADLMTFWRPMLFYQKAEKRNTISSRMKISKRELIVFHACGLRTFLLWRISIGRRL